MEKTNSIAATAADLKATLNVELGNTIQESVLFYIDGRDTKKMVSPFEREMIAENSWAHVLEKREKFDASKGAKFRTWATTVAKNFAKDELEKLKNDPLHLAGALESGYQKIEETREVLVHYVPTEDSESSERQQYWHEAFDSFKRIVSTYSGRDRKVAEMLISERTKEEIMAETQMSGGSVDTCICRLRKKMLADMRKAGFSLDV